MTKKQIIILGLSGAGILIFFLAEFLTNQSSVLCRFIGEYYYQTTCRLTGDVALIAFPIFIFSVLFLFLKIETVFDEWRKFTFIYLFIYLFTVVITPWYAGDGFLNIQKEIVALVGCFLYFVLSMPLILYKSRKLRREKQEL